jgi:hypothetical protein
LGNLFLAGGIGEIDPALHDALEDGTDGRGPSKRHRHVRIHLPRYPLQIIQVVP